MKNKMLSVIMLFTTAMIWGLAFVAQSVGMDYVGAFTFLAARSLLAGAALLPLAVYFSRKNGGAKADAAEKRKRRLTLIKGGILCGIALFLASALQQLGIIYTSVGKAGFITAFYIILVPMIALFSGRRVGLKLILCAVFALFGMYLLCMGADGGINVGDILVFLCALVFAVHITIIAKYSPVCEPVALSCVQFFVCFILSLVLSLIFEAPSFSNIASGWVSILYAGLLSSGVGYTMQIAAQKNINETVASLILSLESVFSAVFGFLVLGQQMNAKQLLGCVIVFACVVISQVNLKPHQAEQKGQ